MNPERPEITGEFREFILAKASEMTGAEMCQDEQFNIRLVQDIFGSGRRKFNKSGDKSSDRVTPVDILYSEFLRSREEVE